MTDLIPEQLKEALELAREDVNDWDMRVAAGMTATDKDPAHVKYARALLYYSTPRPIENYHEDMGDVVCWETPVVEAPSVTSPLASDFPAKTTKFTPLPPAPEE